MPALIFPNTTSSTRGGSIAIPQRWAQVQFPFKAEIYSYSSLGETMVEKILFLKAGYLLVGLSIGSLIGILFAPKSGKETRTYLVRKAKEGTEYAQELRERAEDLIKRAKEVATEKKYQITTAMEVGREAYAREKSNAQRRNEGSVSRSL
jgi:gas vesicle protein